MLSLFFSWSYLLPGLKFNSEWEIKFFKFVTVIFYTKISSDLLCTQINNSCYCTANLSFYQSI